MSEIETAITAASAVLGRKCGTCSLCCYVLKVDALEKAADTWCKHCRPGCGGCSIYAERPQVCRGFACQWLVSSAFGDEWFPQRAKMVCHFEYHNDKFHGQVLPTLSVNVDRRFPNRWREEPYFSQLCALSLQGLRGPNHWSTRIYVGDQRFLLLNKRVIQNPSPYGMSAQVGPDEWIWLPVKTEEDLPKLDAAMRKMLDMMQAMSEHERQQLAREGREWLSRNNPDGGQSL